VKERAIKQVQVKMMNFASKEFEKLGQLYENIYIDVPKRLIMCDKVSHPPEEWQKIHNTPWFKSFAISVTIHYLKNKGSKHVIIAPYNPVRVPGMKDTMISVDGSSFVEFRNQTQKAIDTPTNLETVALVEKEALKVEKKMLANAPPLMQRGKYIEGTDPLPDGK
jgi:hypothetical protein